MLRFNRKDNLYYEIHVMYWYTNERPAKLIVGHHLCFRLPYKIMQQRVKETFDRIKKKSTGSSSLQFAGIQAFTWSHRVYNSHKLRYQYPKHFLKCTKNLF